MNWTVKYKVCGVVYRNRTDLVRGPMEIFDIYTDLDSEEKAEEWIRQTSDENEDYQYDEFVILKVLKRS